MVDHRGCERIRELFTAEIDREASEIDEAAVRRHLRSCPECAEAYEAHVAVARGLRQHPLVRPNRHPLPARIRFGALLGVLAVLTALAGTLVLVVATR
jgi:hypothetical protein